MWALKISHICFWSFFDVLNHYISKFHVWWGFILKNACGFLEFFLLVQLCDSWWMWGMILGESSIREQKFSMKTIVSIFRGYESTLLLIEPNLLVDSHKSILSKIIPTFSPKIFLKHCDVLIENFGDNCVSLLLEWESHLFLLPLLIYLGEHGIIVDLRSLECIYWT